MKRTGLINLICSLIAVAVVAITVTLVLVFGGAIAGEKNTIVISSANATATYNGKELTDHTWTLAEGELREGHRLSAKVTGSQKNVGISENYVIATVKDKEGNDVSDEYNIIYRPGTLNVKARQITITAESDMKEFDGKPLAATEYKLEPSIALISGHTLSVTVFGSLSDVGEVESTIYDAAIFDENGVDVTRNYNIRKKKGKLVVYSPDAIVVKSENGQKYYDGEPLQNSNWTLVSGTLSSGHELVVDVTGSITSIGTKPNDFNVYIVDSFGNDYTSSYSVIKITGDLIIIKQPEDNGEN